MKLRRAPADYARGLLIAVMVAMLFSPPLTSLLEVTLYLVVLSSRDLRARFALAARQPLGALALAFWAATAIGLAYSIAPWKEAFGIWLSWRRLLLLVIGLAVFGDLAWKRRAAWILVGVATLAALASFIGALFDIGLRHYPIGIILRTPPTQGMTFAVAAFAAALLLRHTATSRGMRLLLGASCALLVANVAFITTGRSGYVVLIVCAVAFALDWLTGRGAGALQRFAWVSAVALAVVAVLAASPVVRQRIEVGMMQLESYDQGVGTSPMGERVIYQANALALIAERPLVGHGTGSFEAAYSRLVAGRPGREGLVVHDPHNQYLNIAVQHGLPALALFFALLVAAFRRPCAPPYRILGLGVLAAWCLTSLFSSHFSTFGEGRFIWLWLGICLARDG